MKTIGLIYGTATKKTAFIAKKIETAFGNDIIELVPVENAWKEQFQKYDNIIVGCSTWFDGELPDYWDELLPEIKLMDLKGKKIAIFGLGDQVKYPDNFADGVGILAQAFEERGTTIVGKTSPEEYTFDHSLALKNGQLQGLIIDMENQADKTDDRILQWVANLKKEFV